MATDEAPLCARCKEQRGVLDLRSEAVCQTCFATFVASKTIKRLEVLQRETRGTRLPSRPQRYLLALSRGPSSTALLHILNENVRRQRERNQRVKFELVVVFVDVDIDVDAGTEQNNGTSQPDAASPPPTNGTANTSSSTDAFTAHFPDLPLHTIPLSSILSSRTIDWSLLPSQTPSLPPSQRLADFFSRLPSSSARADVSRLLIRHALYAAATAHDCAVVLLGYTTTSLAELTLSEAAKGRGFGIPWFVNDGAFPLPGAIDPGPAETAPSLVSTATTATTATTAIGEGADGVQDVSRGLASSRINDGDSGSTTNNASTSIQIYSPLREIFRKEILTYLSIVSSSAGPLSDLFPSLSSSSSSYSRAAIDAGGGGGGGGGGLGTTNGSAVISHRDLSLDDVVTRFFADVEASYPSVVANVVRTTGKLKRVAPVVISGNQADADDDTGVVGRQCRLCGVGLDPLGDERWKGEIGEAEVTNPSIVDDGGNAEGQKRGRLCYGCERSVRG
ncbi:hypothetical protein F5Y01DRAFT_273363 [Xylaria sp. FL0043]|nr:hypothetical protein F5Y01DRAFT_273363 [Xylaria sp. FL0043]